MPSILLRCPWHHTGGPAVAVVGGVCGHKDAQSPRGPEEGKDKLDASDSTCDLTWLPVVPGELQQVPKSNLSPFHNTAVKSTMEFPPPAAAAASPGPCRPGIDGTFGWGLSVKPGSVLAPLLLHTQSPPQDVTVPLPPLSGDTKALTPVLLLPCGGAGIFLPQGKGNGRREQNSMQTGRRTQHQRQRARAWMQNNPNSCSHSNRHSPPRPGARLAPTRPRSPGDVRVAPPVLPFPFELD